VISEAIDVTKDLVNTPSNYLNAVDLADLAKTYAKYPHTTVEILDQEAIEAISIPVIEVHLSPLSERKEAWRHTSVIAPVVTDRFMGEGLTSYLKAISQFFDQ
jgi:3-dehydroquinate dehydratase